MRHLPKSKTKISAILGPTNTGKTHFAIERMLCHQTGMIGLPLRLLAREVYERLLTKKLPYEVALITGEEKLIPENPKFYVCTVEAMPLDRKVDCIIIDEVQLAADRDRGHIFTERILNARGLSETIFLGADTIRPILKSLVPEITIKKRDRLSKLEGVGYHKLGRLLPRSAVITFSAQQVYEQAESLRAQKGGCVIVLGALSPQTRNAQIDLYQSGEVDYMVATDAIGMGLNMDLNHVAFASNKKFDGYSTRRLFNSEIAQIAGRAGRYLTNGTFGTTNKIPSFDEASVAAVEEHRFPSIRQVFWRNSKLDFHSIKALINSLEVPPPYPNLRRKGDADDQTILTTLSANQTIRDRLNSSQSLKLFWETCQIPDFTKTLTENHASLISKVFLNLCDYGNLPDHWVNGHLSKLDRTDGDIDSLTARISHIRTWTYIAHRNNWLANTKNWQEKTRSIEDRLSDSLHKKLTQRFVDKRISILARDIRRNKKLISAVKNNGEVIVEGHKVGKLSGLLFTPDEDIRTDKAINSAIRRVLPLEIKRNANKILHSPDQFFTLQLEINNKFFGKILWNDTPIAKLKKSQTILHPTVAILNSENLDNGDRQKISSRIDQWLKQEIRKKLFHLFSLQDSFLSGPTAGVAYQLRENLSVIPKDNINKTLKHLTKSERKILKKHDICVGKLAVYLPSSLKPLARNLNGLLWWIYNDKKGSPIQPHSSCTSFIKTPGIPDEFYRSIGFEPLGPRVIRIDIAERISQILHHRAKNGPITLDRKLMGILACPSKDYTGVIKAFGYENDVVKISKNPRYRKIKNIQKSMKNTSSDRTSPFSILSNLELN
tara:strand:- start:505 stop:3003 length:2499 start_codon:yes stop_codon:yes gene_type:complete